MTTTVGVIFSPSFLRGNASVDLYDIKIRGAISQLTANQQLDDCLAGSAFSAPCSSVTRGER